MSAWDDGTLTKWLVAEGADALDEADRQFAALAAVHLDRLEAPAGLADRVLKALPAGTLVARPMFDLAASWWARGTALASLVLLGLGLAWVSPRHAASLGLEGLSAAARVLDDGLASLTAAVGVWKATLEVLATLGQAAGHVVTTGMMPLLVAANLVVAFAAFAGLRRLLPPREECV